MKYPQLIEYSEALQHPQTAFLDRELQRGRVRQTSLGLPLALSGGFALTYEVEFDGKRYAVRCFHREVSSVKPRYHMISAKLKSLSSNYFVDFDFQDDGIRVGSSSFPIVKMEWASGDILGTYLSKNRRDKNQHSKLRERFRQLARYLEENNIGHGDIQNENVIISNNCDIVLVDYDGMFVDGLNEGDGNEFGHKHFQHPDRTEKHFGPKMDRFSFIVMDISLDALSEKPSLFQEFGDGGQAIILKASDYAEPAESEAFKRIGAISTRLADASQKLKAICTCPIEEVPSLEDFLSGKGIPTPAINVGVPSSRAGAQSNTPSPGARIPNQKIMETLRAGGRAHPSLQNTTVSNIHVLNTVRGLGGVTQRTTNFSRQAAQATPMSAARPIRRVRGVLGALVTLCLFLGIIFGIGRIFSPPSRTSAPTHELSREACEKWSGQICQMYGGRWWSENQYKVTQTPTVFVSKEACQQRSGHPCIIYSGSWWSPIGFGGKEEAISKQSEVPRMFQLGKKP